MDTIAAPLPAVTRAEWQKTLFAARPSRRALAPLRPDWPLRSLRIRMFRNTPVEFALSAVEPFLAFAGFSAEFDVGAYDDALTDVAAKGHDLEILWLDFARYAGLEPGELASWLAERVARLREGTPAPILVLDCDGGDATAAARNATLGAALAPLAGVHLVPRSAVAAALAGDYRDARLQSLAATTVSEAGFTALARALGARWIPAAVAPPLKALALDLDQTLYAGVLGEDGADGVALTPDHRALQLRIAALAGEGMLLGIVSKNRREDVEALFAQRDDFPLTRDMVAAWAVSWGDKAEGIAAIADQLRIGVDAILFIDDNPGEIAKVARAHPSIKTLFAASPVDTLAMLEHFPGLLRWHSDATDRLRTKDLQASELRDELRRAATDSDAYYRSLGIRLAYAVDPVDQVTRLADLSVKTNQFNLALRRFTEAEMASRVADPEARAVAISLSDRLSDSGVIGALVFRRDGETLLCEDLCLSCRALGRDIEDVLIGAAVLRVRRELPASRVCFAHATGPRNEPARSWAARFFGGALAEEAGLVELSLSEAELADKVAALPLIFEGL